MARQARINEPTFDGVMSSNQLINSLNWYHQNKENKDAISYIQDYAKKNKIAGKIDTSESLLTTGWLCRLVANGNDIGDKNRLNLTNKINKIFVKEKTIAVVEDTVKFSIQDRMREKVGEIAGELEGAIDDYIESNYTDAKSPFGLMHDKAKGMHATKLVEIFKKRRTEYDTVLNTKDDELKEGYSNFNKTQLKKIIAYCDQIILDAMKIAGEAKATRKPRKRKQKSPAQLVEKIQYLKSFDDLKLVSIDPKQIIGAVQLWIYNTKTRKLGVYHAEDAGGFSIKGTTILNYKESKSVSKTLRKPETTLPEVTKGGKVALRNMMANIRAKESLLNGRINKDIILLRTL